MGVRVSSSERADSRPGEIACGPDVYDNPNGIHWPERRRWHRQSWSPDQLRKLSIDKVTLSIDEGLMRKKGLRRTQAVVQYTKRTYVSTHAVACSIYLLIHMYSSAGTMHGSSLVAGKPEPS